MRLFRRQQSTYRGDCPGCGHDWREHPGGEFDADPVECGECRDERAHGTRPEAAGPLCRASASPSAVEAAADGDGALAATEQLQVLVGQPLTQLCVGVAEVQLRFDGELAVQLEAPVSVGSGEPQEPYALSVLASLLPLLDGTVAAVRVEPSGALVLTVGPTTVRCEADGHYEAWNVTGPYGLLVVALPGGGLAR